jgi:tetrahydromethanopterin S-methyltransferase subunit B
MNNKQEQREKDSRTESYIQGAFMGFIIGVLYLAIFSTILERL